ncbi:hypothetical protein [Lysinibacillus endophyticus]|uniref:hypothetical protein n=1 Tax=Ureibacillus endophyticus TaxID=1978490 RepID=UPI00209CE933|nr:hypothetical protein [Lysinibacillus endophyticus]MCP1146791.1 hypothetical protein [Lysinibacillus endophyticus]
MEGYMRVNSVDRLLKRIQDPQLNENFTKRVNWQKSINDEDRRKYATAHQAFHTYKRSVENK